jgi:hypothetical protein
MLSDDLMKSRAASGFHEAAVDRMYFKGRTIKLVTARLAEVNRAVADTTIGGVCDLIYLEVSLHLFRVLLSEEIRSMHKQIHERAQVSTQCHKPY